MQGSGCWELELRNIGVDLLCIWNCHEMGLFVDGENDVVDPGCGENSDFNENTESTKVHAAQVSNKARSSDVGRNWN